MARKKPAVGTSQRSTKKQSQPKFTAKQGQYLAYIYLFWKLHRFGPSESEIARYFRVSPPSAHQMIVKLEEKGLITREPGVPRSARVTVPKDQLPELEDPVETTPSSGEEARSREGKAKLYTLEVCLLSGHLSRKYSGKVISRKIQIRGDQTLEHLHRAIFQAYDRWEEHFYEFQFGGRGPNDPKAKRYVLPPMLEDASGDPSIAGQVTTTTIDSCKLKIGEPFGYWFDYGDDWWHQVTVTAIDAEAPRGLFPKIVERVGESPPQYPDEDEDD